MDRRDASMIVVRRGEVRGTKTMARTVQVIFGLSLTLVLGGSGDAWARAAAEPAAAKEALPVGRELRPAAPGRLLGTVTDVAGVPLFSLNTDSSVIPQEEFFLQGAMTARLGGDPYRMLRALTIHPAESFGLDDHVGSLEVGKDADVVLYDGDPLDPRTRVMRVWIDGDLQFDREESRAFF